MHLDMLSTTEKKNSSVKTVGILIFNDVEVLDVAGPFEVFSMTRLDEDKRYETTSPFRVVLLSEKKAPVVAIGGLKLIPDFTFDDCPSLDLFVIPGGWGTRREVDNPVLIQKISKLSAKSSLTASVCTGSSLIGRAGLLDGKRATTHWRAYNFLRESAPKAQIQENVIFTTDGSIFTSAGVASGIRLSLYLVSRFFGAQVGKETARFLEFSYFE